MVYDSTNQTVKKFLTKDVGKEGIILLKDDDISRVSEVNFHNWSKDEKIMELIAYQFELCYNLAIIPLDNVSSNPEFESILGVW